MISRRQLLTWVVVVVICSTEIIGSLAFRRITSPEGSFAFQEAGNRRPPKIRKPPYTQTRNICSGTNSQYYIANKYQTLCGDLNDGHIPANPMGQSPLGEQYPFEVIKKKALEFFAKTIPTLKKDKHIPKVAMFEGRPPAHREQGGADIFTQEAPIFRKKRSEEPQLAPEKEEQENKKLAAAMGHFKNFNVTKNEARQFLSSFCDGKDNIICTLMSIIAKPKKTNKIYENEEDSDPVGEYFGAENKDEYEDYRSGSGPGTPCPSFNEYVTPTFARNHHGIWRYVVQIPYEGYFTQTVQITRCRNSNCVYMKGSCKASPRWVSLLVAEIYYPDLYYPLKTSKGPEVTLQSYTEDTKPPSFPLYQPNSKPSPTNIGPFIRPAYKEPSNVEASGSSSLSPYYKPSSTDDFYYQSLSGYNKDSLLRKSDEVVTPDDFNAYQQHLHQLALAQKKSMGKKGSKNIKIRTKRQSEPRIKTGVSKSGEECDGYDNLGCFVVRMYYDWFVVSGECKCWLQNSRHVF